MADTIEEAMRLFLIADASIAAVIGRRIFPLRLPDKATYPSMSYQRISGPRVVSHCGDSKLPYPRFQFTIWDKDYTRGRQLMNLVINKFSGYAGAIDTFQKCACDVATDFENFDEKTRLFQGLVDVVVWHKES